ncbi:MAG: PRTRC system protein C [Candidatus Marinimicrobia bacterium]|nr:PRTRC system protein C [Candidatus Neomarinimicrobiota bacterium]MDD5539069.1 PRTRC system protein C [Candidatus Neomarinimicrobiota bacterium]
MVRKFAYDNREFPDPDPALTPEQVKQNMAPFFPELATAEIREHKIGEDTVYEFIRKTGTKGTKKWTMPDWMEKYRPYFRNTGGNSIEDLMNDTSTIQENAPRAVIACCVNSQVLFLAALKLHHCLSQDP